MSLQKSVKNWLKYQIHSGRKYLCPVCDFHARDFLPAGLYQKRAHAKCPQCLSLERHRQIKLLIDDLAKSINFKKILHFAPEPGLNSNFKKRWNDKYFTSEYDKNKLANFYFDLENIETDEKQFDLIICSHVLEHVENDTKAICEIVRILVENGTALIQVPIWPSETLPTYENSKVTDPRDRIIHFGQWDHLRIYGLDVEEKLKNLGFSKVQRVFIGEYFSEEIIQLHQLKNFGGVNDYTFICTK